MEFGTRKGEIANHLAIYGDNSTPKVTLTNDIHPRTKPCLDTMYDKKLGTTRRGRVVILKERFYEKDDDFSEVGEA